MKRSDIQPDDVIAALGDRNRELEIDRESIAIQRTLSGDKEAFRLIYQRNYDRVFSIVAGIILDRTDAEDVTQIVFTRALKALRSFDGRSSLQTWLHRIAINSAIAHLRSNKWKRRQSTISAADALSYTSDEPLIPDPKIEEALQRLSPDDRAVIILFYWHDLNLREIAESLGTSSNAAKTRLFRARERFRELYTQSDAEGDLRS